MYGRLTNLLRSTDLIELALNIDHFSTALALAFPRRPDPCRSRRASPDRLCTPRASTCAAATRALSPYIYTIKDSSASSAERRERLPLRHITSHINTRIIVRTTLHKRIARVNCTGYVTHMWYCQCEGRTSRPRPGRATRRRRQVSRTHHLAHQLRDQHRHGALLPLPCALPEQRQCHDIANLSKFGKYVITYNGVICNPPEG